jgi:hypothetical protein
LDQNKTEMKVWRLIYAAVSTSAPIPQALERSVAALLCSPAKPPFFGGHWAFGLWNVSPPTLQDTSNVKGEFKRDAQGLETAENDAR